MFEDAIRRLKKLEKEGLEVKIELDDKGYWDRQCPHSACETGFKVLHEDWKNFVRDEEAWCPRCGHSAPAQDFGTPEQQEYFKQIGQAVMHDILSDSLKKGARKFNRQFGHGFLKMKMQHNPGRKPIVVPLEVPETLRQDFACKCGCRYAIIGAAYFCPACGHNAPADDFTRNIEAERKALDSLESIRQAVSAVHDDDTAQDMCRGLIENILEDLITTFQRITSTLFSRLQNALQFRHNHATFQRVNDASRLWKQATGKSYEDILGTSDFQHLHLMLQRRHLLTHNEGMVDQRYIQQSGDTAFADGQRLVINEQDVRRLADILERLVAGLKPLT